MDRDLEKDSDRDIDDLIDVQMKSKNGPDVTKEDVKPEVGKDHDDHSLSVDDSNRESILDVPWGRLVGMKCCLMVGWMK